LFGGCDRVPLGLVRGFMAAILQWFELLYTQTAKKCANDGVCGQTCSARTFDTTPPGCQPFAFSSWLRLECPPLIQNKGAAAMVRAATPATVSINWGRIRSGSHALNQDRLPKRGNL